MTIENTIQRLTNDGEIVVQFLVDNVQGNSDATMNHRMKSAEWLTALGGFIPQDALPKSASLLPRDKSETKQDKTAKQAKADKPAKQDKTAKQAKPAKQDKPDKPAKKPPVTAKEILHFDLARQIKRDTRDAETIIQFLLRVVMKIEKPGENFTPAVRMRAARELLIRGFGSTTPGLRRILSGKTENLDSYLAKLTQECTNYGADFVLFLTDVMENNDPHEDDATISGPKHLREKPSKPIEGFKASHRVWAACELMRRAYDIRTDHITYEDINAYWAAQTAADPDVDDAPILKRLGRTRRQIELDDAVRGAIAEHNAELERHGVRLGFTREEIDAQTKPAHLRALAAAQTRAAAANSAVANTENPAHNAVNTEKTTENPVSATAHRENSADNPVANADNPANNHADIAHSENSAHNPVANTENPASANGETRAVRRRQQRAAQKAQKRANKRNPRPNRPVGALTPEDRECIEAFRETLRRAREFTLSETAIPADP